MDKILELDCDLIGLELFAEKLAKKANSGDIYLLKGDLGAGKTTFARLFINAIYDKYQIARPHKIKSPSFPIMINYPLIDYEINHYDLYRLKKKNELLEIDILEGQDKNISIIEWPDLILDNFVFDNYYLIKFEFININKRQIILNHSKKKFSDV